MNSLCAAVQVAIGSSAVRLPFSADKHAPGAADQYLQNEGAGGGNNRQLHAEIVELRKAVIASQLQCARRLAP